MTRTHWKRFTKIRCRMKIRSYKDSDAPLLAKLMVRSVKELGPLYYTAQQVQAWASRIPAADQINLFGNDGRRAIVAVDNSDAPIAFIDLEANCHINHLFCSPEFVRQGIATGLYEYIERLANHDNLDHFYSEASEIALPFFLRKGFTLQSRQKILIGDIEIHNYSVSKNLEH